MSNTKTLIKWPGGKSREIKYIENLIPDFDRYIEPFFGGGAMFFHLRPGKAIINDISSDLMNFYTFVKEQNQAFYNYLCLYDLLMKSILKICEEGYDRIRAAYSDQKNEEEDQSIAIKMIEGVISEVCLELPPNCVDTLILNSDEFRTQMIDSVADKMKRTVDNEGKFDFSEKDLKDNLITGFTSGVYMYFRGVYNDILLNRKAPPRPEYRTANFFFIREYCYGSMFRYNGKGEFNIPYGGISYNQKNFRAKIDSIFSENTRSLFRNTEIYCKDFEELLSKVDLKESDFMFLDPPYDTEFSDYEGNRFAKEDHIRLAAALRKTKARFILIIKNTDFIYSLYQGEFNILFFDKTYTYNVRSRNDRNAEHLIITNLPV